MSIIYMLLAVSVIVALVFFVAFIVSVRAGQYDDTYTPSVRMLFEDELVKEDTSQISSKTATESKKKPINIKQK
jgi:cbb3-type cytochrome oxidase maturation protein